jgi:aquaporin Z
MPRHWKIFMAEFIGTTILMLGGPGTAILATGGFNPGLDVGMLGVALAFGLSLLIIVYAVGPISGAHVNPAVTLGMYATKKIEAARVPAYLVGQVVGCVMGALIIFIIAQGGVADFDATPANFAANLYGEGEGYDFFNMGAAIVVEIIFTALLVFVVLSTTHRGFSPGAVGLHIGLTLAVIHLVTIPVDNTSVNPVRSLGVAIFAGGEALEQLWLFILFPLVGAILGVGVWLAVSDDPSDDVAESTQDA